MALGEARGGKYNGADMRNLLDAMLDPESAGLLRNVKGNLTYSSSNPASVVMTPTSDKDIKGSPITIATLFERLKPSNQSFEDKKDFIFPIAEQQKILGIFPRNHWVTVHYNKDTNVATLLDSRPWYASFLYPTKTMEKMLREGLVQLVGEEKAAAMTFQKAYQKVQYNDTHCGAWTAANVGSLAGGTSIDEQKKVFTRSDESKICEFNDDVAEERINLKVLGGSFLARLKAFFSRSNNFQSTYGTLTRGALPSGDATLEKPAVVASPALSGLTPHDEALPIVSSDEDEVEDEDEDDYATARNK